MRGRTLTIRTIALLGAGSAAIHELRYAIGYGDGAAAALAAHPHGYLQAALPGVATALLISVASAILRIGSRPCDRRRLGLAALWIAATLTLAAVYGIQETLEGAGAVAHGGWIGLALAIPTGLLVALSIRGAEAAEGMAGGIELVAVRIASVRLIASRQDRHARTASTARYGRGPPLPSVV